VSEAGPFPSASTDLQITPDQAAALMAAGFSLRPATEEQVGRLAMQRRIFLLDGTPMLVTRDGAYFETAGTLRDVLSSAPPATGAAPGKAEKDPPAPGIEGMGIEEMAIDGMGVDGAGMPTPDATAPASPPTEAAAPDATARLATVATLPADLATSPDDPPPPRAGRRIHHQTAATEDAAQPFRAPADSPPATAEPPPAARPRRPGRHTGTPPRWLTAGAERRGRLAQHWSRWRR
ncbi:hypothetical protein M0638_26095, partial [Roseomonas sp. NAR14]|nr:hypothetical protein [Roseomonas acroporae]